MDPQNEPPYAKWDREAAERLATVLALPLPEFKGEVGMGGTFDPWSLFPLYGNYSSDFDEMAIDVLCELRDGTNKRADLGAEMFREMLCKLDLCSYGTSPRVCFPTEPFKEHLPALIEKWRAYSAMQWGAPDAP